MKNLLLALLMFAPLLMSAQSATNNGIPLIGEPAPAFTAQTTNGLLNFPADFGSHWKILCSHPADFTPVCTSELMALAMMQQDFKNLGVELAVLSADGLEAHKSWISSMKSMLQNNGQNLEIEYPMIDDSKLMISRQYGMVSPQVDDSHTIRAVFIIDPENRVQAIFYYPKNVGRNLEEVKRTLIALQTSRTQAALTPVNWRPGDDVLVPYPYPYTVYDPDNADCSQYFHESWYMLYKKLSK